MKFYAIIKYVFVAVILFRSGLSFSQCYELVWAEEFNYSGLPDPLTWTQEQGAGGWGNGELQYYTVGDTDNIQVADGKLKITARKENFMGSQYTSARLITKDKVSFQYGHIEASIKLPFSQGIWPAFWMLGDNFFHTGWPKCGEIDIVELVGGTSRDHIAHGTAHWDNNGSHAQYGGEIALQSGIFADTFHLFSIEWTPQRIKWFMDGKQYHTIDITPGELSEFHNEFFLLLNVAVGGAWPGNPDQTSVFPQTMEVDYIRVYQTGSSPVISGDTTVSQNALDLQFSLPYSENWSYEWTVPEDAEITSGQGSNMIKVNWGCLGGAISCTVAGSCNTYELSTQVSIDISVSGPLFVEENGQNILFTATEMAGTTYLWTFPDDVSIIDGQGTDSIVVNWGNTYTEMAVMIENSCGVTHLTNIVLPPGQYSYPDPLRPHHIPGEIESVHFDYGGEGIAYHDLSVLNEGNGIRQDESVDTEYLDNGNPDVGWILSGEWLEYTVFVERADFYNISMRVATNYSSGGPFSIAFNGNNLLSGIKVNNTGGWDQYVTLDAGMVYLTPVDTLMRLTFNTGGFNVGSINITAVDPSSSIRQVFTGQVTVYPNPARDLLHIISNEKISSLKIVDISGRILSDTFIKGEVYETDLTIGHLQNGLYFLQVKNEKGEVGSKMFIKSD